MAKSRIRVACVALLASLLAGCGESAVCSKPDVLATVNELYQQQQFSRTYDAATGIVALKGKSATYQSTDPQTKIKRCSVIITVDVAQMLKLVQQLSDAEISEQKKAADARGQQTSFDNLVNYTVQTLASGENYITVLP